MVVIHGGRFEIGDKADAREKITGKLLAKNGIAALSINYKMDGGIANFPTNI